MALSEGLKGFVSFFTKSFNDGSDEGAFDFFKVVRVIVVDAGGKRSALRVFASDNTHLSLFDEGEIVAVAVFV